MVLYSISIRMKILWYKTGLETGHFFMAQLLLRLARPDLTLVQPGPEEYFLYKSFFPIEIGDHFSNQQCSWESITIVIMNLTRPDCGYLNNIHTNKVDFLLVSNEETKHVERYLNSVMIIMQNSIYFRTEFFIRLNLCEVYRTSG